MRKVIVLGAAASALLYINCGGSEEGLIVGSVANCMVIGPPQLRLSGYLEGAKEARTIISTWVVNSVEKSITDITGTGAAGCAAGCIKTPADILKANPQLAPTATTGTIDPEEASRDPYLDYAEAESCGRLIWTTLQVRMTRIQDLRLLMYGIRLELTVLNAKSISPEAIISRETMVGIDAGLYEIKQSSSDLLDFDEREVRPLPGTELIGLIEGPINDLAIEAMNSYFIQTSDQNIEGVSENKSGVLILGPAQNLDWTRPNTDPTTTEAGIDASATGAETDETTPPDESDGSADGSETPPPAGPAS